jgi:phosphoenolpyruvate-protein kinase (PTS system EI component)
MVTRVEQAEKVFRGRGTPISDGVGEGRAWLIGSPLLRRELPERIEPGERGREEGNIRHAIQLLSFVLDNAVHEVTARAGVEHAQIFVALKEILHDPLILNNIIQRIRVDNFTAYHAVRSVFEHFKKELRNSSIPRIQERVYDLIEIEQGLLDALVNPLSLMEDQDRANQDKRQKRVVLSRHLTPRLVLEVRGHHLQGIIAEQGGITSHAAILCRALAIPAVTGIPGVYETTHAEMAVALNGTTGEVMLASSRSKLIPFIRHALMVPKHDSSAPVLDKLTILANINLSDHARHALAAGAKGVGLYRTELEFLAAGRLLNTKEQTTRYRSLVMTMMGLPVTIRLLDVTEDKFAAIALAHRSEINLDYSGGDFLLHHTRIFKAQARAIARVAAFGPIGVLYPRVRDAEQFRTLRARFREAVGEDIDESVQHGAMFELTSACDQADEIFKLADFGSIGTNDLLQSIFATDREQIAGDEAQREADSEVVWKAIRSVAQAAARHDRALSVCGEMAAQPRYIARFLELGIDTISVDAAKIRRLRQQLA